MTHSPAFNASSSVGHLTGSFHLGPDQESTRMSESDKRDARMIGRIRMMIDTHDSLCSYTAAVKITVENAVVVLRGELPSEELKRQLLPVVRQSGVLSRVNNHVTVTA